MLSKYDIGELRESAHQHIVKICDATSDSETDKANAFEKIKAVVDFTESMVCEIEERARIIANE